MAAGKKSKKRYIEAEDICRFRVVQYTAISPDENLVVYNVETVSEDKRKYFSHLYVYDRRSGETRQFTRGEISDQAPVFSPDGSQIAFISTRDKKTGLYVMPTAGGAERLVLQKEGMFLEPVWTPDGRSLVYSFIYNDSHAIEDEKKKKEAPLYRHITRLYYRWDGMGFRPQDSFHIYSVEVESGRETQLTNSKYDDLMPSVSPDGRQIVYMSNHSRNPDLDGLRGDLFLVSIKGGKIKKIPTPDGPVWMPVFSPDGKKIAYFGHDNPMDAWGVTNFHLWTVGVNGKPKARDLVPKFDRHTFDRTAYDLGGGPENMAPVWSADSRRIYFQATDTGNTHIFYVPARGGLPTRVTGRDCHVKAFGLNGKTKTITAVVSDLKNPRQLILIPTVYQGDKKAELIADPNKKLMAGIKQGQARCVWFKAHDKFDLQGWLVTPPNFNRKKKYPAILEIHGGPRVQYGNSYFHEMRYLAAQGYVVFYTNPRGGNGRGQTFAESIVADWGGIDYDDIMAAADYLENLPYVNGKKMGVTGGSYGGYMTNWVIGHTDRFRAAVTQRSVYNLNNFLGSSDIGFNLHREFDGHPWENPETYHRCSPSSYVKNIKTPLLVIHSEKDIRSGIEQGENLFATLKLLNKKVEMVRFPEESHGLSRHGRPDRRIARLEWIVKWFNKFLK